MKLAIVASLFAGAAAFVPSAEKASSSALLAKAKAKAAKAGGFENELGVQPPLGFWDPLGYLDGADAAEFNKLRGLEIKHGRVAQLAFLGYITTEFGVRLPGAISLDGTTFESIPGGFAALSAAPAAGLGQIILFAGFLELYGWKQNPDSFPGDYSASSFPVGFLDSVAKTPDQELKLRAQELNQGRAAMMGILSLMVHEGLGVDILPPH